MWNRFLAKQSERQTTERVSKRDKQQSKQKKNNEQFNYGYCAKQIGTKRRSFSNKNKKENMVQKYQSPVRVYKYPFELVMKVNKKSEKNVCYARPEMNSWMKFSFSIQESGRWFGAVTRMRLHGSDWNRHSGVYGTLCTHSTPPIFSFEWKLVNVKQRT